MCGVNVIGNIVVVLILIALDGSSCNTTEVESSIYQS